MEPPNLPSDFFTLQSIITLGGASAAVLVVTNTVRKLLGWKSFWVGFVTSLLIVFYGAYASDALTSLGQVLISLINTCLLFCTAFGLNESAATFVGARQDHVQVASDSGARRSKPWLMLWLAT